jgi:hypothetical protein
MSVHQTKGLFSISHGKQSVVFEVGDYVYLGNSKGYISCIDEKGNITVDGKTAPAYRWRFINQNPKNIVNNAVLKVIEQTKQLDLEKEQLRKVTNKYYCLNRRKKSLESKKLVSEAITVQLRAEFPDMF